MTEAVGPGAPGRVRPGSVTVSSYLLYVAAATQVISAVIAFATAGTVRDTLADLYAGVEGGDKVADFAMVGTIVTAVISLLLGAGFVVLAMFNNRGKNPSRIVTWVVGGLSVCCGGLSLIGNAVGSSINMGGNTGAGMPSPEEVQRAMDLALPGWYQPSLILVGVIGLLALLVALILLALPPSNEFFRKPPPAQWEPPVPGYQPYPGA